MTLAEHIGSVVSHLRSARHWTQMKLRNSLAAAGVHVTRQVVTNVEKGRTPPSYEMLVGLMRVFGVRLTKFFPKEVQLLDDRGIERERLDRKHKHSSEH